MEKGSKALSLRERFGVRASHFRLLTERLWLRNLYPRDCHVMYAIISDDRVREYWVTYKPVDEEHFRRSEFRFAWTSKRKQPRLLYYLAAARRVDCQVVGFVTLDMRFGLDWNTDQIQWGELGYWLNPAWWGQGYATEAASAVLRFALDTLQLPKVVATCFSVNLASRRVLEKIGMTLEARYPDDIEHRGRLWDKDVYSIVNLLIPSSSSPT